MQCTVESGAGCEKYVQSADSPALTTRKTSLGVDFLSYGPRNQNRGPILLIGLHFKFRRLIL